MKWNEVVRARLEQLEDQKAAKDRGEDPRAIIPISLREFDKRAGIKRKIMTLVGASTGEGKDLWQLHLMESAAKNGYTVEVISMEDPTEYTADRSLSKVTGINNAKLHQAEIDEKDLARLRLAAMEAEEWGELIEFHQGAYTAAEALKIMKSSKADLKIVNYLQAFPDKEGATLERTIAEFCWEFNKNANDTGSANVAFSQTNLVKVEDRGLEYLGRSRWKDPNAPPNIEGFRPFGASDLAWCTAAGIRAKDLQILFRPGRYLRRAGVNVPDDKMEITRPKNNFGAEGKIAVGVDLKTARFYDLPEKSK